ncbi:hypothetical protein, partial [Cellulomonas sp.]|uniref:hypothetical protein n=1 Tax=Cellulomonas sp. TaxID=40001 RepID=UPI001B0FAFEF
WEPMQDAFRTTRARSHDGRRDDATDRAWTTAVFLVHTHFLRLVQRALAAGPLAGLDVPIAVTTHDLDMGIVLAPLDF